MIVIDLVTLAGVSGGAETDTEPTPGPNRTEASGSLNIKTPLFETRYDQGTTRTAKTDYAACLDSQPRRASAADIVAACGLPKRGP